MTGQDKALSGSFTSHNSVSPVAFGPSKMKGSGHAKPTVFNLRLVKELGLSKKRVGAIACLEKGNLDTSKSSSLSQRTIMRVVRLTTLSNAKKFSIS